MAGHSGGSWKVAYADFVTAMMAFFLVMWLCAQDQKIKESVANYFQHPTSLDDGGFSRKPVKTGAVFQMRDSGNLPHSDSIYMGRGRNTYTNKGELSSATKLFSDWLHTDEPAFQHWRKRAERCRELAKHSKPVIDKVMTVDEAAAGQLAEQLEDEITREISSHTKGLNNELLRVALAEVNWTQLAEDLLSNLDKP